MVAVCTFNEAENIELMVAGLRQALPNADVIVVDDNSPDGTAKIVAQLITEFPEKLYIENRKSKNGLGTAYIHGFKWAIERKYDYIIEMDADFSHNPKDLNRLYHACKNEGADVSIGSRYSQGVNVVNWPMKRVLLSYFASKYVRFITRIPVHDTTAGFVCYKRNVLETIELDKIRFVGYAFQIEMKFKAWKHKFTIKEVSVIFRDRTLGDSKMSGGIVQEALFGVIKMKLKGLR